MMRSNTLLWISLGSVAAGGALLLLSKESKAMTQKPPLPVVPPAPFFGEQERVVLDVPAGWRRATNAEVEALPELGAQAVALRNTPGFASMRYGILTPVTASDGQEYATWIEQHFHEPGGAVKPWGLHHGVTVLAKLRTT